MPSRLSGRDRTPWQDSRLYRERARELAPQIHRAKRWNFAVHEAGHFLVAAYEGEVLDSIGLDVGTLVQMGVVVRTPARSKLTRTEWAAVLVAGGLAQARIGIPLTAGTASDEDQLADLGLSSAAVAAARQRAAQILDLVWPDVDVLANALVDHTVITGEMALAYVLAYQVDDATVGKLKPAQLVRRYAAMVDARRAATRAGAGGRSRPGSRSRTPAAATTRSTRARAAKQ
jgi:hypothetical protein